MNYIQIGKIVNTHGLKGEVKVVASTDFKHERYLSKKPVYIFFEDQYLPFFVKSFREHKGADLITFKGQEDINLVEKYKGCDLFSEDFALVNLQPGEFHVNQLLGLKIIQFGNVVGKIMDIREYPQGDYLVISKNDGSQASIPFRDEFVESVDQNLEQVIIREIEGLL